MFRKSHSGRTRRLLAAVLLIIAGLGSAAGVSETKKGAQAGYEIALIGQRFTPPEGIPAEFPTSVKQIIERRKRTGQRGRAHVWVQFVETIDPAERKALREQGVTLLESIGGRAWRASVSLAGLKTLSGSAAVRWADVPRHKADPQTLKGDPRVYQLRGEGQLGYIVTFYADVDLAAARDAVSRHGGLITRAGDERFAIIRSLEIVLEPDAVPALLEEDPVAWLEPVPPPNVPLNRSAQAMSRVDRVQAPPYDLSGSGIAAGVWDFGAVQEHGDLAGRVRIRDGAGIRGDHPTVVAGALAGDGSGDAAAEGMAPGASIQSFDWDDDFSEMRRAARTDGEPPRVRVSNHSYGPAIGWWRRCGMAQVIGDQSLFGQYTDLSRSLDSIVTGDDLVIVQAAGNHADERDPDPSSPPDDPDDCRQSGLPGLADCVGPRGSAKNVITVGAARRSSATRVERAVFSSVGPTDDGRIKPDLVADGWQLFTTTTDRFYDSNCDGADDFPGVYGRASGTSLSAPVVSGIVALLMEEANRLGLPLAASSYKAALIQSADAEPNYQMGWGVADAQEAVDLLRHPFGPCVDEQRVSRTGTAGEVRLPIEVAEGQRTLKVTIAWSDPPAAAGRAATLVNDLDLVLVAPDGATFRPWLLNPADPRAAARRAAAGERDTINNVEKVTVRAPTPGLWQARISASRLETPTQLVSIAGACTDPDVDDDGHLNDDDNCPRIHNPAQSDLDGDGDGDLCDGDLDGDGFRNGEDVCPRDPDPETPPDTDGDGTWDSCDRDDDGDCVADGVDNCPTVRNCNFFGRYASARLCDDPCGPVGNVEEMVRFIPGLCLRLPINPECFTDGCGWPPFFKTPVGDPRELLKRFANQYPGMVPGLKLLDQNRVLLPTPEGGLYAELPQRLESDLIGQLKGKVSRKEIERLFGPLGQGENSVPKSAQFTSASMGVLGLPNELRGLLCGAVVGRLYTPDARGSLKDYRACRERHRAEADQCQMDSDEDGTGDACE